MSAIGTAGQATFGLRLDARNLIAGLDAAKTVVRRTVTDIDALLSGIGTKRASISEPFSGLQAELATLKRQYADLERQQVSQQAALQRLTSAQRSEQDALGDVARAATTTRTELAQAVTVTNELAGAQRAATTAAEQQTRAERALGVELARTMGARNSGMSASGGATGTLLSSGGLSAFKEALPGALAFGAGLTAINATMQVTQGLFRELKSGAIDLNAELQQSAISWNVLLGSSNAAQAKLKELFDFASRTPFTFKQVDDAARLLERFGGPILDTTKNLTLLGNVASGTGRPLDRLAFWIGRLYDSLQSGQPIGRATLSLQQMGAISGETARQVKELQKQGADMSTIWQVVTGDMSRFSGQLEAQSKTWTGATTTFHDQLQMLAATAGRPIFDGLTASLNKFNQALSSNEAKQGAEQFAAALRYIGTTADQIAGFLDRTAARVDIAGLQIHEGLLNVLKSLPGVDGAWIDAQIAETEKKIKDYQDKLSRGEGVNVSGTSGGSTTPVTPPAIKQAGQAAGQGYVDAFTQQLAASLRSSDLSGIDLSSLKQISDTIDKAFTGSMKLKGIDAAQLKDDLASINVLVLEAENEISQNGEVSATTMQHLKDTLGDTIPVAQELFDTLAQINTDKTAQRVADAMVTSAETALKAIQDNAKRELDPLKQALTDAQNAAKDHARQYDTVLSGMRDHLRDVQDAAKAAQQAWQDTLDGLRTELDGLQQAAEAHKAAWQAVIDGEKAQLDQLKAAADQRQEEFKRQLDDLNTQLKSQQDAASQHAGIYKAILEGTTAEYLKQLDAEDALTQKIVAKWDAEIAGKLRAKTGADERVTSLERKERADLLTIDERIRAARQSGNEGQARALERRRSQIKAQYDYQLQLERERAAVAKDRYDQAAEGLKREAKQQAETDDAAVKATEKKIKGVEAEQKAQKARDDAAIKAQEQQIKNTEIQAKQQEATDQAAIKAKQEQIKETERQQRAAQRYWQAEQDGIAAQITNVERQKKAQADRDQAVIDAANTQYIQRKAYWDQEETRAKANLENARAVKKIADDQLKTDQDHLKNLDAMISRELYINQLLWDRLTRLQPGAPPPGGPQGGPAPYETPSGAPGAPAAPPPYTPPPGGTPPTPTPPGGAGGGSRGPLQYRASELTMATSGAAMTTTVNFGDVTVRSAQDIQDIGTTVANALLDAWRQTTRSGVSLGRVRA